MKQRILNKLTRLSRKNILIRPFMLVVIFVYLAFCHFMAFLYREKEKWMLSLSVLVIAILGSSFALPVLLSVDSEEASTLVYSSNLNELISSGKLEDLIDDSEETEVSYYNEAGYEDYDPDSIDSFSIDDLLLVNSEYLSLYEENDEKPELLDADQITRKFSSKEWSIILVNKQHPIPDDYTMTLTTISGSMRCDERVLGDLLTMLKNAKNEGISLIVCSPYRDMSKQVSLFERKINAYMRRGLNYMDAYKLASQAVTVPGASEHQLGLSMDIYSANHKSLDWAFGDTPAGRWLAEHSWEYGFILRYPKGKEYITSIEYEPWHFRYVGKEAAAVIKAENITLEEFWELYVEE